MTLLKFLKDLKKGTGVPIKLENYTNKKPLTLGEIEKILETLICCWVHNKRIADEVNNNQQNIIKQMKEIQDKNKHLELSLKIRDNAITCKNIEIEKMDKIMHDMVK